MKTNNIQRIISVIFFIAIIFSAKAQSSGTIVINQTQYIDDMYEEWYINIGVSKPVSFLVNMHTEMDWDYVEIYSIDNNGVESSTPIVTYSGIVNLTISTNVPSGRAKVVFVSDGSVSGANGNSGISIDYSADNSYTVNDNLYVKGDAIVDGKLQLNSFIRGNSTGGSLKVQTDYGNIQLGAQSGYIWAHIYTDLQKFIFNKPIHTFTGEFSAYNTMNLSLQTNSITRMTILNSNGNVGIGTTNPNNKFEVIGNTKILGDIWGKDKLSFQDNARFTISNSNVSTLNTTSFSMPQYGFAAPSTGGSADLWISGNNFIRFFTAGNPIPRFNIAYNGNVGIGADLPATILQIAKNDASVNQSLSNTAALDIWNSNGGSNTGGQINFRSDVNTGVAGIGAVIGYLNKGSNATGSIGDLVFGVKTNSTDASIIPAMTIKNGGNVSIGTTLDDPGSLLTVNGVIHAKEIKVDLTNALADFVFDANYTLMPLHKVEAFVKTNKHLPELPTATEVKENGLSMGEMQNKLLQKIEELTLYVIEQNKRIETLEKNQK